MTLRVNRRLVANGSDNGIQSKHQPMIICYDKHQPLDAKSYSSNE